MADHAQRIAHKTVCERLVRRTRTDSNHGAIVQAFRDLGCSVLSLSSVGKGCPDLLVSNGPTALVEVKDGESWYGKQKRESQETFKAAWKGKIFLCKSIVEVPGIVRMLG